MRKTFTFLGDIMVRYNKKYSFRMNQDLKNNLKKFCEDFNIKESEYVRKSLEKCLIYDMMNGGKLPNFNTFSNNA